MSDQTPNCKICEGHTKPFGEKRGRAIKDVFQFCRCQNCGFVSVTNPCLDMGKLYDRAYYRGKGADPLVDYYYELNNPKQSVRRYEWRGIARVVSSLGGDTRTSRWLDYGCGNGGLVRFLRDEMQIDAVGYDQGAIVEDARASSIPILDEAALAENTGKFSVVTMIEVLEHVPDPIATLAQVRRLLKPDGLLFLTTGNSEPHLDHFLNWSYVRPDIHISYFTPQSLELALVASGFSAQCPGYVDGWDDIVRFKVLKSVGFKHSRLWESLVPWGIVGRFVDAKYRASAHPIGKPGR